MYRYRLCDIRECADLNCNHLRMQCMPCYGRARARKRQSGAAATTGAANTSGSFGAHSQKKKSSYYGALGRKRTLYPLIVHTLGGGSAGTNVFLDGLPYSMDCHSQKKKKFSLWCLMQETYSLY